MVSGNVIRCRSGLRGLMKIIDIIVKRGDVNFIMVTHDVTANGWNELNSFFYLTVFEEVSADLVDAVTNGTERKERTRVVPEISLLEHGSTFAPWEYQPPLLIAKLDESDRELLGLPDTEEDEEAFRRDLPRELSRCIDYLALFGIAKTVWE